MASYDSKAGGGGYGASNNANVDTSGVLAAMGKYAEARKSIKSNARGKAREAQAEIEQEITKLFGSEFSGEAIVNGENTGANTAKGLADWLRWRTRTITSLDITFSGKKAESYAKRYERMTEQEKLHEAVKNDKKAWKAQERITYDDF